MSQALRSLTPPGSPAPVKRATGTVPVRGSVKPGGTVTLITKEPGQRGTKPLSIAQEAARKDKLRRNLLNKIDLARFKDGYVQLINGKVDGILKSSGAVLHAKKQEINYPGRGQFLYSDQYRICGFAGDIVQVLTSRGLSDQADAIAATLVAPNTSQALVNKDKVKKEEAKGKRQAKKASLEQMALTGTVPSGVGLHGYEPYIFLANLIQKAEASSGQVFPLTAHKVGKTGKELKGKKRTRELFDENHYIYKFKTAENITTHLTAAINIYNQYRPSTGRYINVGSYDPDAHKLPKALKEGEVPSSKQHILTYGGAPTGFSVSSKTKSLQNADKFFRDTAGNDYANYHAQIQSFSPVTHLS